MKYNKNGIIEAIGGLKILLHDFEKKATPRVPFKAMRHALATAIKCCEKQIPKKVDTTGSGDDDFYICPVCKERLESIDEFVLLKEPYCSNCGQKLDWGD